MAKQTQASLKSVYALVGSDPFLQLERLRDIVALFEAEGPQRSDFDGERSDLISVLDELRSFSMFASAKLVVVRDADEFVSKYREQLERFLSLVAEGKESIPEGSVMVLRLSSLPGNQRVHKLISKVGEVVKCEPPGDRDLPGWIMKRAKSEHGVEVELAAANELANLIGGDLGRLNSELSKLALVSDTGKVTPADVASSVSFQREQEVKEVTGLLGRGRTKEALEKWRHLVQLDPAAEFKAITWLGIWLEKSKQALQMKERGVPVGQMGNVLWIRDPAELKDFVATATKLGRAGVTRKLVELADMDRRVKSGLTQANEAVERFIAGALEGG
jgi:DNA polymerase-3 subunit delta